MSLLTRPRHTVQVVNVFTVQDADGAYSEMEGDPVTVRCNVHPTASSEVEEYGPVLSDSYTLTVPAGQWPGDERSRVIWEGDIFFQVGRSLKSRMGTRTRHDRVVIQRGNPDG